MKILSKKIVHISVKKKSWATVFTVYYIVERVGNEYPPFKMVYYSIKKFPLLFFEMYYIRIQHKSKTFYWNKFIY